MTLLPIRAPSRRLRRQSYHRMCFRDDPRSVVISTRPW